MGTLRDMLRNAHWAVGMTEKEFQRIEAGTFERSIPTGGYVCYKNEPIEHWNGVIDGLVKMSNFSFEGKAITFTGVPHGGWFGEGSILKNELRKYDVVAMQESRIAYMHKSTFLWLLDNSITFNRFLITQLNERLGQAFSTIECERLMGPDGRVARCLANIFNPVLYPGLGNQLRISQEELGYLTGLSRQRVNQAIKALEEAALLKAHYGRIEVFDLAGLRGFNG